MTPSPEKLREAVLYFANHPSVAALGLTKLYKLLYFADVRRLRDTGESTITGSEYIRYPHGPVPSRAEREMKQLRKRGEIATETEESHGYRLTKVTPRREANSSVFCADELELLDLVAKELGRLTAKELSDRSHAEPAWRYASELGSLDPSLMHYGAKEDPEGL